MRASFDEIAGKGLARRDEIYPLIASLIRAERTHRQARSISYRIGGAKFPVLKDIDTFAFADTPIDEGQVRELATGTFLDAKRNARSPRFSKPAIYGSSEPRYADSAIMSLSSSFSTTCFISSTQGPLRLPIFMSLSWRKM